MHKNLEKTKGFPCKNLKKVGIVYRELCSSMCKLSRLIKQQTKKIKGIEIVFIRNLGSFEHGSLFDRLKLEEDETIGDDNSITVRSSQSETLQSLQSAYGQESPSCRRRVRFELPLPRANSMDPQVRDELNALIEAKHAGVAYIMGHSYVKARRNSSFLKKFVIDVAYSFLRKNCRGPSVALHIPHISLIEVGMIYYV